MHHHWTIQKAKNGDILVLNEGLKCEWIGIFKAHTGSTFASHCHYNSMLNEFVTDPWRCKNHGTGKYPNIHPATTFQKETLFKAMEKAGYMWNVEKKELKKIQITQP